MAKRIETQVIGLTLEKLLEIVTEPDEKKRGALAGGVIADPLQRNVGNSTPRQPGLQK